MGRAACQGRRGRGRLLTRNVKLRALRDPREMEERERLLLSKVSMLVCLKSFFLSRTLSLSLIDTNTFHRTFSLSHSPSLPLFLSLLSPSLSIYLPPPLDISFFLPFSFFLSFSLSLSLSLFISLSHLHKNSLLCMSLSSSF